MKAAVDLSFTSQRDKRLDFPPATVIALFNPYTPSPDFITISKAKSVDQIQEMIDIVSKQTEYDKTEIIRKLIEHNYNIENVIKDYNNLIEHRKMMCNKFIKDNKELENR